MDAMRSWAGEADDKTTLQILSELALLFCARVEGEIGSLLTAAVITGDYATLLQFDPHISIDSETFYNVSQIQALFKKLPSLPLGLDPKKVAVEKFLDGERKCRETNYIFNLWKQGQFQFVPAVESILHSTARKIQRIVGVVPEPGMVRARFSAGGASTNTKKKNADLRHVIADSAACSEELLSSGWLPEIMSSLPALSTFLMNEQGSQGSVVFELHRSRLDFVRKDARTDRVITVEPPFNKAIQNGLGDHLRGCLKRIGCDLSQQAARNSELARIGSVTGGIATLDLSNASGLLSYELVAHLWPIDWMEALDAVRSAYTSFEDVQFTMQAYAGMGNGTTFPVESITFLAITQAVVDYLGIQGVVAVYGDDIICPTEAVPLLVTVLSALGLEVNETKSFAKGPFRESCGRDWYTGYDVRPVFVRGNLSPERLFTLHNYFARKGDFEATEKVLSHIPPRYQIFGPDGFGDGHLLGEWRGKPYVHTNKVSQVPTVRKDGAVYLKYEVVCSTATSLWSFETYSHCPNTNWTPCSADVVLPVLQADSLKPWTQCLTGVEYALREDGGYKITAGDSRRVTKAQLARYVRENALRWLKDLDAAQTPLSDRVSASQNKGGSDESLTDSYAWIKGTPMPGTKGGRRLTVCTFEQPTS